MKPGEKLGSGQVAVRSEREAGGAPGGGLGQQARGNPWDRAGRVLQP